MQRVMITICLKPVWLACLLVGLTGHSRAQATVHKMDDATWNAIDAHVTSTFALHNLKGLSVAVVYGGNIAYANAIGNKNNAGDPFTIYTKSLLASISKTITGTLAMRMVQNGDISLNDPISDYLPDYDNSGITIAHLLSHQGGIAHYDECPGGYSGPFDPDDSYDIILDCEICMTPPGSGTLYSTFGSTLLGIIIQEVGMAEYGIGYHQLYYAWMHSPGNLGSLEPAWDNSDPSLAEGSEAEFYWDDIGWRLPAGGFKSNILDLANYARGFLNNTYVTNATFNAMTTIQVVTGNSNYACGEAAGNTYGLSFRVAGTPGNSGFSVWHNGLNDHGYSSFFIVYPDDNAAIVMLTNTGEAVAALDALRQQLEPLVLCPDSRNFTNVIDWTEPRIFEAGQITGQSLISSTYNEEYIFDAGEWVILKPGVHIPSGKTFTAQTADGGCGGVTLPD